MRSFHYGFYRPIITKNKKKPIQRSFKDVFARPILLSVKKYALYFDGSNDYISFSNKIIPAGYKNIYFEISKASIPGVQNYIFTTEWDTPTNIGDGVRIDTSGKILWINRKGVVGDLRFSVQGNTNICDGEKHKIRLFWDGTTDADTVQIFVDDMLDATATADSVETLQGTHNMLIGQSGTPDDYLTATIYKILMSDKSGYVAKYFFHEGTGSIIYDISGNGYDGTITGATWIEA